MKPVLVCDNCDKEFKVEGDTALQHVFPDIPGLLERLEPGGEVPSAECPNCGALVYLRQAKEDSGVLCPKCGSTDRIAQIDTVEGYALIQDIDDSGEITWAGETEVEWNSQKPASVPPQYICLACHSVWELKDIIAEQNHG